MEIPSRFKAYTCTNLKCQILPLLWRELKVVLNTRRQPRVCVTEQLFSLQFPSLMIMQPESPSTTKIYKTDIKVCFSHRRGLRVACKCKVIEKAMFTMGQEQRQHLP